MPSRASAAHRPAAVTGAEHPRQRARHASPGARSACWSPTAPTPRCSHALRRRAEAEGATLELDRARRSAASRRATARSSPPTRRSTAGRRCSTTPSCCSPSADGAAQLATDAAARDFVSDAFAHCKFIGYVAAATPLLDAAGVAARIDRRLRAARHQGVPRSSSAAATCGTGTASRWSPPCNDCTAVIMSPVACAGEIWCRRSLESALRRPPATARAQQPDRMEGTRMWRPRRPDPRRRPRSWAT